MGPGKRILVVDDEPGILHLVQTSLNLAGYEVISCTGGEEALELARAQKPDVILLDIVMQPLTGFDVLVRLRAFSQTPVIVFTARREIVELAMKAGATDYIAKPFMPGDLVKKIQGLLEAQRDKPD